MTVDSTDHIGRFDTTLGPKTYAQINDLIAAPLRRLMNDVQSGWYDNWRLDVGLVKHFHHVFLVDVMPSIAGRWRIKDVRVGSHLPPSHWNVDRLMRELFANLRGRIDYVDSDPDLQVEALAYAEAGMLNIHPFEDFNGRTVRVLITELARRFGLPLIRAGVKQGRESDEYMRALREYDLSGSVLPMRDFWLEHRLR